MRTIAQKDDLPGSWSRRLVKANDQGQKDAQRGVYQVPHSVDALVRARLFDASEILKQMEGENRAYDAGWNNASLYRQHVEEHEAEDRISTFFRIVHFNDLPTEHPHLRFYELVRC